MSEAGITSTGELSEGQVVVQGLGKGEFAGLRGAKLSPLQLLAGRGARLRPDDWKSGDRLWLIEMVSPFATTENKLQEAMVADLVANVFKKKTFKFHAIDPSTGKREEKEIG